MLFFGTTETAGRIVCAPNLIKAEWKILKGFDHW